MTIEDKKIDDRWYSGRLRELGAMLSAWFALECACRAVDKLVEAEFAGPTLGELQSFLLGRSTWFDLEATRRAVDGQIWSTRRSHIRRRLALHSLHAATFPDDVVQHVAAAQYARRLDTISAKPLTEGVKEEELQQSRLDDFSVIAESGPIQELRRAYNATRDLGVLAMFADALQDEGFSPPV